MRPLDSGVVDHRSHPEFRRRGQQARGVLAACGVLACSIDDRVGSVGPMGMAGSSVIGGPAAAAGSSSGPGTTSQDEPASQDGATSVEMPGDTPPEDGASEGSERAGTDAPMLDGGPDVVVPKGDEELFEVNVTVSGTGTVSSLLPGIACTDSCSARFARGRVVLQADSTNGSGHRFAGWSGGGCSGVARECAIDVTGAVTLSAAFEPASANLIFVTSRAFATNLGSAAAYDGVCNEQATAAGINDAAGSAFVALVSDSVSLVGERLGAARGWIRMDGRPFADSQVALFLGNQIYNAVQFDERGNYSPTADLYALTGMNQDGSLSAGFACDDWSNVAGQIVEGNAAAGPISWASNAYTVCNRPARLICMGKNLSLAVAPLVSPGRRIWLSSAEFFVGGGQTPDQRCQAALPSGVTSAAALIARTDRAAAELLDPATVYVRPDGTRVGTGAQIGLGTLESGLWQTADGSYLDLPYGVLTGSPNPALVGTLATTCGNWADPSGLEPATGDPVRIDALWWTSNSSADCSSASALYCVQTAP